ncbi:hypothetical protein H4S02_008103 [Coemansia sp. RSA 2611]|nr:hypothetical protein IWW52_005984 [Coemansia sp. RSA 2704]KAJ2313560.1 hypothetical protein IWW54_001445 [Coemansia sp. RSA 2705]KAJ2362557.1 hypothetical protein H4S01_004725 [Coemansia sp. RSA 2610]KAJ2375838.1 hypothetical protein H4S02_008103 [Coemansia sp. RSA 2611]KAJ2737447.1 hypothetical protein H4R23_001840 [Coemansia sp. Cherry 401B]
MRSGLLAFLLFAVCAVAWNFPEKVGVYSMIHKLNQYKTGSMEERIIYGKLSMFLGDWRNSAKLSSARESTQYRDALLALLSNVNTVRSDAINDPAGVDNLEYLVIRIRQSYGDSLRSYFGT